MPISSIILNENNLNQTPNTFNVSTQPAPYNRFYLNIPNGVSLKDHQIAIQKINTYYSFPNISVTNYQAATIEWDIGGVYSSFQWDLTSNYNYSTVSELNNALQQFCIENGLYLINGSDNVYYLTLNANPNSYGIDLTLFPVPTSAGSYTEPINFVGYPSVTKTPKITFKSEFNKIVGFPSLTEYDGGAVQTTWTSTFSPQLSPVSSILVSCNLAHNQLALNGSSSIMTTFTTTDTIFGSSISIEPNNIIWFDINANISSLLIIEFFDQNYNILNLLDPQTTIQLLIRKKTIN